MIEICGLKFRSFEIKVCDEKLTLKAPKIKFLKKLGKISTDNNILDDIETVISVATEILNSNMQHKHFSKEVVESKFTTDDLVIFLANYINWVREVQQNPNFKSLT